MQEQTTERFRLYCATFFEGKEITPDAVRGFAIHLGQKHIAPQSVKRYYVSARPWLNEQRVLGRHNVSAEAVAILLKNPKCPKGLEPVALKLPQVKALLTMALSWPDLNMAKFVLLGLTTGARVGEIASIEGESFNASEGTLHVFATKTNTHRYIPVRWSSTLKALASRGLSGPLLSLAKGGESGVRTKRWRAFCKGAGVAECEPRALRRVVATAVAGSGKLTTAAYVSWLGHLPTTGIEFYHDSTADRPEGSTIEEWLLAPDEFAALLRRCFN